MISFLTTLAVIGLFTLAHIVGSRPMNGKKFGFYIWKPIKYVHIHFSSLSEKTVCLFFMDFRDGFSVNICNIAIWFFPPANAQ